MTVRPDDHPFELFISYAHADDRDACAGRVSALVQALQDEYRHMTSSPLRVFFDVDDIRSMDDWEHRIYAGLRQSRVMLAVLSPAYFASPYCRKEWERYVEHELALALPGEGLASIYVLTHPAFDGYDAASALDRWLQNLKRRQYLDFRAFWPDGMAALQREDVRRRIQALEQGIADRLGRAQRHAASPTTVPPHNERFVGRREELRQLREALARGRIGAITAVHGIGGIGKSALAFEYAHAYGDDYPGGRFLVSASGVRDLRTALLSLAPHKGVALTDEELRRPDYAYEKVRRAFESGGRALWLIDNVDNAELLEPAARGRWLPAGEAVHVLVTTRLGPDRLPDVSCVPLDSLPDEDALALLRRYRPFAEDEGDAEWKAALRIVRRLGGHALAVEVVAVYLGQNPAVSYRSLLEGLEQTGLTLVERAGAEAQGKLSRHSEAVVGRLLQPTLDSLTPLERRAVEYAALLPPDHVPLPWLRALLAEDFPEEFAGRQAWEPDPWERLLRRLAGLRLLTPGDEPQLGRVHRLVQDVVAARMESAVLSEVNARLSGHALQRVEQLDRHWGEPGLLWEVAPIREFTMRLLQRGERSGIHLVQWMDKPLRQLGQFVVLNDLLNRSVALGERLAKQAPDSADYARDLSVSFNKLGDLHLSLGDPQRALAFYEKDLAVAERLAKQAPDSADYARDLSVSFNKLGDLHLSLGDPQRALAFYEQALATRERLAKQAPDSADYARDLSVSFNKLGDLHRALGDPQRALAFYEQALAVAERLAKQAPDSADYARDLSVSFNKLGDLHLSLGDPQRALAFYEQALATRERLAKQAPDSADYARDLWVSCWRMGQILEALENPAAESWWRRAHDVLSGMVARGLHVSPEDRGFLQKLQQKLGMTPPG